VNVKSLEVQLHEKFYSFQEEFNDKIKEKIYATSKKTVSAIKNKAYRVRLEQFRSKLQNVYQHEQDSILATIQEEKQFQYQHDSETMAQMLIPNMAPYRTLREIISSEQAFKKIFGRPSKPRSKTEQASDPRRTLKKGFNPESSPKAEPRTRSKESQMMFETIRKRYDKLLLRTPSTVC
jgi:hypothetical protein